MVFKLRCQDGLLRGFAERYSYGDSDALRIGTRTRAQGFMTASDFRDLCEWKTRRSKKRCLLNSDETIAETTRLSFSAISEQLHIGILTSLEGVDWATASAILHFCHATPYPILDRRAFWTLGFDKMPHVTMSLWLEYAHFCRSLADRLELSMRDLDRGLWQYSKETQPQL